MHSKHVGLADLIIQVTPSETDGEPLCLVFLYILYLCLGKQWLSTWCMPLQTVHMCLVTGAGLFPPYLAYHTPSILQLQMGTWL